MGLAVSLHVLSIVVWVGGMFFAYMCLRPVAASQLDPPVRLTLWVGVFGRFFPWVWAAVILTLATGLWMIFGVFGGMAATALYIHAMLGLGVLMMMIYLYVYFSPYQRLKSSVSTSDWPAGGKSLSRIRTLVGVNTLLGILTIVTATMGPYLIPV